MAEENNKTENHPIDMIPVIHELTEDMLKEAQSHLPSLKKAEEGTEKIAGEILARTIKTQIAQYKTTENYLEQCQRWRNENLSKRQQQWADEIETTAQALRKTNEEVARLARLIEIRMVDQFLQERQKLGEEEWPIELLMGFPE